ncbi:aquaporin Z [Nocardioides exalbidus]|uniref:Aquaporin Z n=1 Tax=Nocardioides exalbidus TaxID=402596 RepID=A0A1H4THM7_9ACTN|nr:aquaporin [Nocardioides exalbidus]SEC55952.1 aquaporin Z [Nocardioides exalbidus]
MSDIAEDTPSTGQKFTAELLGTFVLVFFGCGAAIYSGGNIVSTGLTFGLTVVVMAYAVGRISGGHFNPAVTLGAVLGGRLPWNRAGIYMAAQLNGGLLAGAVLFGLGHGFDGFTAEGNMGQNFFGDQNPVAPYAWWAALLLEILLTAVFLWVILAVTDERNQINAVMGPLAIGLTLSMIHFVAIPLTGTSVNPARSIGVGVFAGTDAIVQLWLFVVAPFVGAAIAGLTYPILFGHGAEPVNGSGLNFGGGRKNQPVPGNYEAQWNQGQQGGWGQPGAAWGAPPQQQWGQPAPQQQPPAQQPDPYAAPQQQPPAQWGQPAPQQQPPAQQPGQPGQWGAPQQQPPAQQPGQQPGQPGQPGHWGNPDGDDDGRTQVRRPD